MELVVFSTISEIQSTGVRLQSIFWVLTPPLPVMKNNNNNLRTYVQVKAPLCILSQLYGAFWCLSAHCFGLQPDQLAAGVHDLLTGPASQQVAWPSGLRRWIKAPVSSGAWVRIPPLPVFCLDNSELKYASVIICSSIQVILLWTSKTLE